MQTFASSLNADSMHHFAQQTGMVLMALATVIGMVEFPEHRSSKIVVNSPAFVFATDQTSSDSSAQRRERDESAPHYIGYSAFQRTPGRTGKY